MEHVVFERAANYEDALAKAAGESGVYRDYWDIFHQRHETRSDVRQGILRALGWDVSSFDSLENDRARRFYEKFARALPKTLVVPQSDPWIPLSVTGSFQGSLAFEVVLEEGARITGPIDTWSLKQLRHVVFFDHRWTVFQLRLPAEIPLGYHVVSVTASGEAMATSQLIVCPERAYIPEPLAQGGRLAGFNIALYGLRSQRNWGCGDFTDLRELVCWARHEVGFGFIGLNPLHALHNRVPYNTSPYLPLSMFYKNLIYIDIESVPEFQSSSCARALLASPRIEAKIQMLRRAEFVDYQQVDHLKRRFLKLLYRQFRRTRHERSARRSAFTAYCEREGELLHKYALYRALDEILHKQDRNRWTWRQWPEQFHSPDSSACQEFAHRHQRTIEFYKYVQFVIDEQLAAVQKFAKDCGMPVGLYHDLAVATDSCGSDLWAYRNFYVNGCRVGSPPDDFSPNGQDWAFPPPHANSHFEDGYRLYRESIRKIVRHGGALRLDHVMRLFRLFWIPDGFSAKDGTYVQDNAIDLMRILALESVRSGNIIVGEDLGTVTEQMREMLAHFGILSYRLFYFEKHQPDRSFKQSWEYPRQALVASTTHDLPTIAGFWSFRDIEARRSAGLIDEAGYQNQMQDRIREKQRMLDTLHAEHLLPQHYTRDASQITELDGDLHNAVTAFLAQVPSMLLLLNQEDFTKEGYQQNLPGSTSEYPNWQRKMKVSIEELRSPWMQPFSAMFRHQLARTGRTAG